VLLLIRFVVGVVTFLSSEVIVGWQSFLWRLRRSCAGSKTETAQGKRQSGQGGGAIQ